MIWIESKRDVQERKTNAILTFRHNFERIESDSSEAIKLIDRRYARKQNEWSNTHVLEISNN